MDPLAHTLVGATLAQTPLKRLSRLAAPTLILAANVPDIDAVTMFVGRDVALGFRRGWTHGVLALAVLPLLLVALILLVDRVVDRRNGRNPFPRAGPLLFLSYIGTLTHPMLDWLNTYGVRLLMPFDERWFYGDVLFVVDPWLWLLAGSTVVLATTDRGASRTAWLGLGVVLTALVTGFPAVPPAARLLWLAGVTTIACVRVWGGVQTRLPRVASACLVLALLYMGAMIGGSRLASRQVTAWLAERGEVAVEIMSGPLPANPFVRDVVVVDESHYHFLHVNWLRADTIQIAGPAVDRGPDTPVTVAARGAEQIQGLMTWIRFPAYTVEETPDGYRVVVQDVRYGRRGPAGLGDAVIELDRDLQVQEPR